jgi:agmatine deiminase
MPRVCDLLRLALCAFLMATPSAFAERPRRAADTPSHRDLIAPESSAGAWENIEPIDLAQPPSSPADEAQRASGRVPAAVVPLGVLPGEFEKQQSLVIACGPLVASLPDMFAELVERLAGRIEIIALVDGPKGRAAAIKALAQRKVAATHVHYVNLRHNSMWARDFGPHAVRRSDGRWSLVDAIYNCPDRSADDSVPIALGEALRMPVARGELRIDGGNLLANGRGLIVATYALAERNLAPAFDAASVRRALGEHYGARDVLFLEPLAGEPTAHVDMFMTFTAHDTVVVAQFDPAIDLENSQILDRSAARLASVRVGGRRLRVVRLAMPRHDDAIWRTYTNVIYANGLVLVPTSGEFDKSGSDAALATYKRLLPAWQVEPFDAEPLVALGGALHCVTMNLGRIDRLPPWEDEPLRSGPARELNAPRRLDLQFETAPTEHRVSSE